MSGSTAYSFNSGRATIGSVNPSKYFAPAASVEMWFKTDMSGAGTILYAARDDMYDVIHADIDVDGHIQIGGWFKSQPDWACFPRTVTGAFVADNSWHHMVANVDNSGLVLYLDGAPAAAAPTTDIYCGPDRSFQVTHDINLGSNGYQGHGFIGSLDNLAVYYGTSSAPLTLDDARNDYSAAGYTLPSLTAVLAAAQKWGGGSAFRICERCLMEAIAVGDPIDPSTGNYYETVTDVAVSGRGPGIGVTRTFNSQLAATLDGPFGHGWTFNYGTSLSINPTDQSVTITQGNAAQETFIWTGVQYQTPSGADGALTKNADGTFQVRRGAGELLQFDSAGRLTAIRDLDGYQTTLAYDAAGHLATATDSANRQLAFHWTGNHITSVDDPLLPVHRTVTYGYEPTSGDLISVIDVAGGTTKFGYDSSHRVLTMQDPRQVALGSTKRMINHYDTSGRVDWQKDATGALIQFAYATTATGTTTTITDPTGHVTVDYFAGGLLTKQVNAPGTADVSTVFIEYDPVSLGVTKMTDSQPTPSISTAKYDSFGHKVQATDPMGRSTSWTYNGLGQPLTIRTPDGVFTTNTYTGTGHVTASTVRSSDGLLVATTSLEHADATHPEDVTKRTDARNQVWTTVFEPSTGYVQSSSTPPDAANGGTPNTTTYAYNNLGWATSVVAPRGNKAGANPLLFTSKVLERNGFGQPTKTADPLGRLTQTAYDENGTVKSVIDPLNQTTAYGYDEVGRLLVTDRPGTTADPSTAYNPDGSIFAQVDGNGASTTYTYDAAGRPKTTTTPPSQTNPAGDTTTYFYNQANQPIGVQYPGGNCAAAPKVACTTTTYNPAGQPTTIDYSDATADVTVGYDQVGRRTSETAAGGTASTWEFDSLGRLAATTDPGAGRVAYGYEAATSLVTSMTYPGQATPVAQGYDALGRMTWSKDFAGTQTSFGFDADSHQTTTLFPGSQTDTNTYDPAGQLTNIAYTKAGATVGGFAYTRDANGQVTAETPSGQAATTYGYNQLNQLTTLNGANTWTYDKADNLTRTATGKTQAFNPAGELCWASVSTPEAGAGCLTSVPADAVRFGYDNRGRRTTKALPGDLPTSYRYDEADRLTSVSIPAGAGDQGQYNALNPARILDTRAAYRSGTCDTPGCTTLAGGDNRTLQVTGIGGIPATGVDAVVVNVTAITASGGVATVWPADQTQPLASNVNTPGGGVPVPNLAVVKLSATGKLKVSLNVPGDVIIDVQGWYAAPGANTNAASVFTAITPTRLMDTRDTTAPARCANPVVVCTRLAAGTAKTVLVAGQVGVPANAASVALNVTVTASATAGVLTVWRSGDPQPGTSNLNFLTGQVIANHAQVPIGTDGRITIAANTAVDVIIDVQGYDTPAATPTPGAATFTAVNGTRLLDTRTTGPLIDTTPRTVTVAGQAGVPANATAVMVNLTAVAPTNSGFVVAYPADTAQPTVSNLNYTAGQVIANTSIIKLSTDGQLKIVAQTPTNLIIDIQGWYTPATNTWTYQYNPDGLRTTKTSPTGVTTNFTWNKTSGLPLLLTEKDTTGTTTHYLYDPNGLPYAQIANTGTVTYLHHDQLGSTRTTTNPTGTTTGTITYDPYGKMTATGAGANIRLNYAGQYTDPETGHQYLRARYYDPTTAQFLTRDPIAMSTRDPYGYAARNPLTFTDPSGLYFGEDLVDGAQEFIDDPGGFIEDHEEELVDVLTVVAVVAVGVAAVACISATAGGCLVVTGTIANAAGAITADIAATTAYAGGGMAGTMAAVGHASVYALGGSALVGVGANIAGVCMRAFNIGDDDLANKLITGGIGLQGGNVVTGPPSGAPDTPPPHSGELPPHLPRSIR